MSDLEITISKEEYEALIKSVSDAKTIEFTLKSRIATLEGTVAVLTDDISELTTRCPRENVESFLDNVTMKYRLALQDVDAVDLLAYTDKYLMSMTKTRRMILCKELLDASHKNKVVARENLFIMSNGGEI